MGGITAAGLSLYENFDELSETGAIDPIKQGENAVTGLGKMFDTEAPLFSMQRLEGAGETISGATGAVLGVGTQIGKAVNNMIPDDLSDSVVDSIVGLFGGETNADREKKAKEIEEKAAKEIVEKKKAREAAKLAAVPVIASEIKAQEADKALATSTEDQKKNTISQVVINQPADKPIPVLMTDEKGKPIITSSERIADNSKTTIIPVPSAPNAPINSNAPSTSKTPSDFIADVKKEYPGIDDPGMIAEIAKEKYNEYSAKISSGIISPISNIVNQQISPQSTPSQSTGTYSGLPAETNDAQKFVGQSADMISNLANLALTKAGDAMNAVGGPQGMSRLTGQHVAYTPESRFDPNEAGVTVGGRSAINQAQQVAAIQDNNIPATPTPLTPVIKSSSLSAEQVIQGAATGVAGMAAAAGVPGASSVTGAIGDWKIGQTSKKYEVGKGGAGTVSSGAGDYGGVSYGSYQMSSKMGVPDKFVKQSPWASEFAGLKSGTPEFTAKWKELAKNDPAFGEAQHEYIKKTHYDPHLKGLQKEGIDLSGRGAAVQDMLWSTGVQFGGGTKLVAKALSGKDLSKMSDSDIVSAVQDYKIANNDKLFSKSNDNVRAGTLNRAKAEKNDLIALSSGNQAVPTQTAAKQAVPSTQGTYSGLPAETNDAQQFVGQSVNMVSNLANLALTKTGDAIDAMGGPQGMARLTGQHVAYTPESRFDPNEEGVTVGGRSQQASQINSDFASKTFSGSVPPAAIIPQTVETPSELQNKPNRVNENWQLFNNPTVQATINALKTGGANILQNLDGVSKNLGIDKIPSMMQSGISSVEAIRNNGLLPESLSGDLQSILSKVSPDLSNVTGIKNAFDSGLEKAKSGLSSGLDMGKGLVDQFTSRVSDNYNNSAVPDYVRQAGDKLSQMSLPDSLKPNFDSFEPMLASMGFSNKTAEMDATAERTAAASSPTVINAGGGSSEKKIQTLDSRDEPIAVRNPESAIRELTKMILAFSFG